MYLCENCGQQVRPASEAGIVYAVELIRADSLGPSTQWVEGLHVFFHDGCYPNGSPHFRREPMPPDIDDGE